MDDVVPPPEQPSNADGAFDLDHHLDELLELFDRLERERFAEDSFELWVESNRR